MKRTKNIGILVFLALLMSSSSFAGNGSSSRAEQINRILGDPILQATVVATEKKYDVTCFYPETSGEIQWRCTNGPGCSYTAQILCSSNQLEERMAERKIEFSGYDSGERNDLNRVVFRSF